MYTSDEGNKKPEVIDMRKVDNQKRFRRPSKKHIKLSGVAVALVLVSSLTYVAYKKGEANGKKIARADATLNFNNALLGASTKLPIETATGTVTDVNPDKIVVEVKNQGKKSYTINSQTKFTLKTDTVDISRVKKDSVVTVFASTKSSGEPVATRILVRSE